MGVLELPFELLFGHARRRRGFGNNQLAAKLVCHVLVNTVPGMSGGFVGVLDPRVPPLGVELALVVLELLFQLVDKEILAEIIVRLPDFGFEEAPRHHGFHDALRGAVSKEVVELHLLAVLPSLLDLVVKRLPEFSR